MSRSVEAAGPDIDSAVAQALAELGAAREQVEIEVLEQPSRRLLGLGVRPARVRVTLLGSGGLDVAAPLRPGTVTASPIPEGYTSSTPTPTYPIRPEPELAPPPFTAKTSIPSASFVSPVTSTPPPVQAPQQPETVHKAAPKQESVKESAAEHKPRPARPPRPKAETLERVERSDSSELLQSQSMHSEAMDEAEAPLSDEQFDREAQVGVEVVQQLLVYLEVEADVTARRAETDGREARHWLVEVHGQGLDSLIGPKGETLSALQYIARLVATKHLGHRANLVVDVGGFKAKREEMLRRLAKRMAGQAVELKRTVSLEPMPPYERRIVHLTLRDHPGVTTESVGEGDRRKVTIVPRRKPLGPER